MEGPETKYATVGDADIAYQVTGDSPLDLLFCYGFGSAIDLAWDEATTYPQFYRRLASFSRLILFDRRGTGSSDPIPSGTFPTWESWAEDAGAILDAVSTERAVLFGALDAGALAVLYAAMHPERVQALILLNSSARFTWGEDYPIGMAPEALEMLIAMVEQAWGTRQLAAAVNPAMAGDDAFLGAVSRIMRVSATPRQAATQFRYLLSNVDVRPALDLVQVPTLVLNVAQSAFLPIEQGRYLAEHIAGARFVELPGAEMGFSPPLFGIVDEIAEFLTGHRPVVDIDRILTTVLFTDIVASTQRAVSEGDHHWGELLDSHHQLVRDQLHRFRGREVDTAGDGFLATFDGPARAIRCACAIRDGVQTLGLNVRAGLHTGEVEIAGDDIRGIAVHIGARIGATARPNEVLVSHTVKDLVAGSGIEFEDRGEHELKGVPGSWALFAVRD